MESAHGAGKPRSCPVDGTALRADGYCDLADGFPFTIRDCPDACPQCGRHLRWDGDCPNCLPAGAKPGHLYDFTPYDARTPHSGHWRIVVRGPQPIVGPTPEQRATLDALFRRMAGTEFPRPDAAP
jgi:hypothetical protein